jgi:two-component system response regulator PilR (NtrC family)
MANGSILVVDDETNIRGVLKTFLENKGFEVFLAEKFKSVSKFKNIDIVLLDVRLPDANGIESIHLAKSMFPYAEVIIITAYEKDAQSAVKAMKMGAFDYLVKPFKLDELFLVISNAMEKVELKKENDELKTEIKSLKNGFYEMVGLSSEMQTVYEQIKRVADSNIAVLVQGESGTGKELCAKTIHKLSKKEGKFVAINCAAIPENLLESELFGYERGAFSGAVTSKKGLLEEADMGSLFLDEIGDMPLELQAKMLRFLEDFELRRLGGNKTKQVNVRIIAATNKNLIDTVKDGGFREDLFYRLSGFVIKIPPLRRRKEDIPLLVKHILSNIEKRENKKYKMTSQALKALLLYDFPGNIRELNNIINQAAIMSDGVISYESLPNYLELKDFKCDGLECDNLDKMVENYEKKIIKDALTKTKGVKTKAAEMLGVSFRSLRYKVKKYNLDKD